MNNGFIELKLLNDTPIHINSSYIVSFKPNTIPGTSGSCVMLNTGDSISVEESCSDIMCKILDSSTPPFSSYL